MGGLGFLPVERFKRLVRHEFDDVMRVGRRLKGADHIFEPVDFHAVDLVHQGAGGDFDVRINRVRQRRCEDDWFRSRSAGRLCATIVKLIDDFRVGGVAPVPWRSGSAEREVEGMSLNETTIESAVRAAMSGTHPLAYNEYKVALVKKLVRSALTELAE